jgi:aminoglycoside 6'-N-acetyltransferase I
MRRLLWPQYAAQELLDELLSILADPTTPVFVAEREGGGLCGFLEAGTRSYAEGCRTQPVGYIEGWYVDAEVRHQGIGGALVRAAEDWARSLGLQEMGSDTDLYNSTSYAAHLALGYRETDRAIHFAREL